MNLDDESYREKLRLTFKEYGYDRDSALKLIATIERQINAILGTGDKEMTELLSHSVTTALRHPDVQDEVSESFILPEVAKIVGTVSQDQLKVPGQKAIEIQREVVQELLRILNPQNIRSNQPNPPTPLV